MFSPYYGSIAKHIALSNDWVDLVFSGHDWLDKPHFPFWITAISFKTFGINSFAYILPGFLFNLIGVYYTYRLARLWYNKEVGVVAALFTITSMHLMLSSIDVRAEAFLVGEIMGACYYWLKYDLDTKFKYLLYGAIFTALAMMTKGIFVLITIASGFIILWLYQKRWRNLTSFKWLCALLLSFIFIAPELIALYLQFDSQPNKIVFGMTHVSGIRWFFWDSQFGRFFNTGPISVNHPENMHYLYFVYTFLWAYLPWWPVFFAAIATTIKAKYKTSTVHNDIQKSKDSKQNTEANIFLFASFFIPFIVFSVTKFQIDHYTNILFPFASIIAANWFISTIAKHDQLFCTTNYSNHSSRIPFIYLIETGIAILLLVLVAVLSYKVLSGIYLYIILALVLLSTIIFILLIKSSWIVKTITYPTIAICITFIFAMFVNGVEYAKYDAGYQMAAYLNKKANIAVLGYQIDLLSLDFNSKNPFTLIPDAKDNNVNYAQITPNSQITGRKPILLAAQTCKTCLSKKESLILKQELFQKINTLEAPIYLVTTIENKHLILNMFPLSTVDSKFSGTSIETYLRSATNKLQLAKKLDQYVIIRLTRINN